MKSTISYTESAYNLLTQTLNNLQVGVPYDVSFDMLGVVGSQALLSNCQIYVYHDTLSTANLIQHTSTAFVRGNTYSWKTYGGRYTPTSSSALIGFYVYCAPYTSSNINLFRLYFDNAKAIRKGPLFTSQMFHGP